MKIIPSLSESSYMSSVLVMACCEDAQVSESLLVAALAPLRPMRLLRSTLTSQNDLHQQQQKTSIRLFFVLHQQ